MPTDSTIAQPDRRREAPESLDNILDGLGAGPRVYISLAEAVRELPPNRAGRPVHVATLTRWILDGIRAGDPSRKGERIRLRAIRRPGGWMTSREWLAEFLAAVTADRLGRQSPAPMRTPADRRKAAMQADKALAAAGF